MADQGTPPPNGSNRIPRLENPPPIRLNLDANQAAAQANRQGLMRPVNLGALMQQLWDEETERIYREELARVKAELEAEPETTDDDS